MPDNERILRTVGVEEELLLVDAKTGRPRSVAAHVLRLAAERDEVGSDEQTGGSLDHEFKLEQVETDTTPQQDVAAVEEELRLWRDRAIRSARQAGAHVLATGTSPMGGDPKMVKDTRYDEMTERFGLTASEQLTCGCHVHVSVDSTEEAIAVVDRIRDWLPVLLALSSNSPFWRGNDTHYASFRSQAMARWPSSGPLDVFGSARAWKEYIDTVLETGVILDLGMLYSDVRPSQQYPTVEVRVADVCLDARDAMLQAALSRALVDTAAAEWEAGEDPIGTPTTQLRLATWQAGRYGVTGQLLDPRTLRPAPAWEVVDNLRSHCREALRLNGDLDLVDERLDAIRERGTGSRSQREVLERTGRMTDVIAHIARVTAGRVD